MDPKPKIIPTPEQGPKILSFEEFSDRSSGKPRYNNFFLHFVSGFDSKAYREEPYFRRFVSEHLTLDQSLCDKIQDLMKKEVSRSEALKLFDRELYEAYRIMRSYGISDDDLFA